MDYKNYHFCVDTMCQEFYIRHSILTNLCEAGTIICISQCYACLHSIHTFRHFLFLYKLVGNCFYKKKGYLCWNSCASQSGLLIVIHVNMMVMMIITWKRTYAFPCSKCIEFPLQYYFLFQVPQFYINSI